MAKTRNPDFMNGIPELLVLRLLQDREMYGYELVSAVRHATGGEITLGEGVIYPTLHDLEARGLLVARRRREAGRTRIYYGLTGKGAGRLDDAVSEWSRIVSAVVRCMEGGANGVPQSI